MQVIARTLLNGRVQETQAPSTFDSATSLPPLIRRFPREASPTEPPVAILPRDGEPAGGRECGGMVHRVLDLQRQNVRFSLLYFGGIDTPFWDTIDPRVQREKMLRREDAGRWVVASLSPGTNGVLGELVIQPMGHQQ